MPLNDSDPLAVTLTAGEWNQVLAVLGEGPFRIVANLINKIHSQGQAAGAEVDATATNGSGQPKIGNAAHVPD